MEMRARLKRIRTRIFAIRGREAKPAPLWFNALKTLLQSLVMWTTFLVLGPLVAIQIESFLGWPRLDFPLWLAISGFALGWILAWTSACFLVARGEGTPLPCDSTRQLVISGPYRWVRNPMALGSIVQGLSVGLALGSSLTLIYALCGAVGWNFSVRAWEEHDLEAKFGAEFLRYKRAVKCWLPRMKPYDSS